MFSLMIAQITLAAAAALGVSDAPSAPSTRPSTPVAAPAVAAPAPTTINKTARATKVTRSTKVAAGRNDKTALDILNDTRRDILGRGASRRCPPVKGVYVNGALRLASKIDRGFSRATLYFAGDTVMVMLPPSTADALRTVPAKTVRAIRYVDCRDSTVGEDERNMLYITTK